MHEKATYLHLYGRAAVAQPADRLRRGDRYRRYRRHGGEKCHGPAQRGDALGVLRTAVRGYEPGVLRRRGAGHRAEQRRRRRQGDDRRGIRRRGHRPGRAGELHLYPRAGQGRSAGDLRSADQAGRLVPGGPQRRGLRLERPEGQDHHRRAQGRRAGDDAGIRPQAARHRTPGGRGGGHLGAVQHDGRGLHRRTGGLCDAV